MSDKFNKLNIFKQMLDKIKEFDTIIIHRHIRPDGDCIGCQTGLKHILMNNFPNKKILASGFDVPEYLSFMTDADNIEDKDYENALVIVVDTGNPDRVFDERFKLAKDLIRFDHHDDNDTTFGSVIYVDETCSACAGIIADFANSLGLSIPKRAAEALYFGITTDTGRFRYRGVDGDLLRNSAKLIDLDIDIDTIYTHLYTSDFKTLKVRGYVLRKFKQTEHGVLYMSFTNKTIDKLGIDHETASSTVNELDCVKDSIIWLCFIEQPNDEIRVRIRSRFVPINDIASKYRGGGHLCAAGATLLKKSEMKSLLKELDQRLVEYKLEHPEVF